MAVGLVVGEPFGEYARGTVILGKDKVEAVLAGPNAGSVTRFTASDAIDPPPASAPQPAPEPAHEQAPVHESAEHQAETSEKGA